MATKGIPLNGRIRVLARSTSISLFLSVCLAVEYFLENAAINIGTRVQ